jgi:hypothetical protein
LGRHFRCPYRLEPLSESLAHVAHMDALKLQNRLERARAPDARLVSEKPCVDEDDAFEALVATPATTLAGLLAWLAYLQELDSEFETEWMITDRACPSTLINSFAASLQNVGVVA